MSTIYRYNNYCKRNDYVLDIKVLKYKVIGELKLLSLCINDTLLKSKINYFIKEFNDDLTS